MLTGAVVTIVVQSSSATAGMVIGFQGLIAITAGIPVMLGAELGACADTLVRSDGRSRAAIKTGPFHLLFNFFTTFLGMLLLPFILHRLYCAINRRLPCANHSRRPHAL
jgi:phosphate:Na+ symporter